MMTRCGTSPLPSFLHSGPNDAAITLPALTPVRLNLLFEVILAVIDGDLLPSLNLLICIYPDPAPDTESFSIRRTGMVDITGCIAPGATVNGSALIQLEKIFGTLSVCLLIRYDCPCILNDLLARGNGLSCE